MRQLSFVVHGAAASAGSKRRVPVPGTGGARFNLIPDDRKAGPWRERVAQVAGEQMAGRPLMQGAVGLRVVFYRPRPKSHFGASGNLKPSAPKYPATKPDCSKQVRAIEDALNEVVWRDDALVCDLHAYKRWGAARAEITVQELE